ncbi:Fanconi anemia group J protein homolog [Melitaea cinxia]|uniref:Fanconi anemia group J protein homolog n=1 Tax=Melitaea cinxia TaxID=113334 RepID=UPI001E2720CE|nr:Fanconi anemia group J protein homolog [Melitaea cinxia]
MKHFYSRAECSGALLLAVYRGKAAEGMDFKDRQARAIVAVGIPFPNIGDIAIKGKMEYNDRYSREKNILGGHEWLKIQAYRALNQAVGRCVRHKDDWGAVLLVDSRLAEQDARQNLPTWVKGALERNSNPTFESLQDFFKRMSLEDK